MLPEITVRGKKPFLVGNPMLTGTSDTGIQCLRDNGIDQRFLLGCETLALRYLDSAMVLSTTRCN